MTDFSATEDMEAENKNELIEAMKLENNPNIKVTEEEFQNFMHRVNEVEKVIRKITSTDEKEQELGMFLADQILEGKDKILSLDDAEVKVKTNRTLINKSLPAETDPGKMSQESFKQYVSADAQKRYENRKVQNERADTYKRIGNGGFKAGNYEKAVTYFSKALEHRKDSAVIWNNRALSYMKLGLYEKALADCEWALRLNDANIKALLNSAKCHKMLMHEDQCQEFIKRAKEKNPEFNKYISDFEKDLNEKCETPLACKQELEHD